MVLSRNTLPDGSVVLELRESIHPLQEFILSLSSLIFFFILFHFFSGFSENRVNVIIEGSILTVVCFSFIVVGFLLPYHKTRIVVSSTELQYCRTSILINRRQFTIPVNQLDKLTLDCKIEISVDSERKWETWRVGILTKEDELFHLFQGNYHIVNLVAENLSRTVILPILDRSIEGKERVIQPHETDKSIVETVQEIEDIQLLSPEENIHAHLSYPFLWEEYGVVHAIFGFVLLLVFHVLVSSSFDSLDILEKPYLVMMYLAIVAIMLYGIHTVILNPYIFVADGNLVFVNKYLTSQTLITQTISLQEVEDIRVAFYSETSWAIQILTDKEIRTLRSYSSKEKAENDLHYILQMIKSHLYYSEVGDE